MTGNKFSNIGLIAMADAIQVNTKLLQLELCRVLVDINEYFYNNINYTYFFHALEYNTTLQTIAVFYE